MSNARLTPNIESSEMPAYLLVGRGKYYSASPQRAQTSNKHGKKLYPEKNFGVSGDAPPSFLTPNCYINYSKEKYDRYNDFGLKKEGKETKDSSPSKNNEVLPNNISQIQTFHIKNQFSPVKSPTNKDQTPEIPTPAEVSILELNDYKDIYNTAYNINEKIFHRKHGYFMDYTRKNKIILDQYTDDKQSTMHTRYISKPVIFTNLQTRNNLSVNSTNEHSKLLITLSDAFKTSTKSAKNRPRSRYNTRQTQTPSLNQTRTNNASPIPIKMVESSGELVSEDLKRASPFIGESMIQELKINSPDQSYAFTFKQSSNADSKDNTFQDSKVISPTVGGDFGYRIEPLFTKGDQNKPNKKRPLTVSNMSDIRRSRSQSKHSSGIDSNLINIITPENYLKHENTTENKITSKVLSEYVQESSKLSRTLQGNTYNPDPWKIKQFQGPKDQSTAEQIEEFEKRLKELSTFNSRMGKQRWCYNIDWKYNT